jgi:hypothetical protein
MLGPIAKMRKCNFIYVYKKRTAIPSPIIAKLSNHQQRYAWNFYNIEFNPNSTYLNPSV